MKLFLRTPEGLVSPAVAELGHARTLVRDDSNGFGPVSILVQNGVAGMYHLYVQPSKGFEVSNAQVCIFDKTGVIGCYAICPCEPSNGEVWWDVAVFTLDDNGRVTGDIRQLMSFEEEEPGYGVMQVSFLLFLTRRAFNFIFWLGASDEPFGDTGGRGSSCFQRPRRSVFC